MVKGKTSTGFKFEIDERIKDDFRLLRCIRKAKDIDPDSQIEGSYDLIALLLGGEKGVDRLVAHVMKLNNGFCPQSALTAESREIMNALNVKN